ncbi:MAG: DUF1573 domain-containing protein [Chloroflexota bacterium]|nr:MAG: DUF1573 domain-containing protein [Chloroflexota bacterium]
MKPPTKAERTANRLRQRRQRAIAMMALGGVLLLALAALLFKQLQPAPKIDSEVTGAPSLRVDQEKIDLGDVKLGQTVSATFRLTNVGDEPLKLVKDPYIEVVEGC